MEPVKMSRGGKSYTRGNEFSPDNLSSTPLHHEQFGGVPEYERMFGRKSRVHTHPSTHPLWMSFSDHNCSVCGKGDKGPVN